MIGNRIKKFFKHVRITNHRESHISFNGEHYASKLGYAHGFACRYCAAKHRWRHSMVDHMKRKHNIDLNPYLRLMSRLEQWTEGKFDVKHLGEGEEREITRSITRLSAQPTPW